jgi:thiol:disulfide interchange protein DsbD
MGGVTGLVASPCVGPVLIVLLTWVAKAGSVLLGFWLLFVFALGLGVLFVVLGTFAGAISALPRSGEWMAVVKHVFGVILIAMGLYYLKPVIGETAFWVIGGVFTIFVATFTGVFNRLPEETTWGMQFRKGLGTVLLIVGVFVLGMGLMRAGKIQLAQGPAGVMPGGAEMAEAGLNWLPSDDDALAQAQQSGQPVLVDFYADWCPACRELDEKTWVHPDVANELKRFVLVKLDFTKASPELAAKQSKYGVQGLPTVILMDSKGEEINRFSGFRGPEEVLEMLKQITVEDQQAA